MRLHRYTTALQDQLKANLLAALEVIAPFADRKAVAVCYPAESWQFLERYVNAFAKSVHPDRQFDQWPLVRSSLRSRVSCVSVSARVFMHICVTARVGYGSRYVRYNP